MDSQKLFSDKWLTVHQQYIDGALLEIKETKQYRWFEYGGISIQSLMSIAQPEKVMMPVSQSLLLFLLIQKGSLNVLNLGLGGGALERALVNIPNLSLSSVDASQSIIDMAKDYFNLPEKIAVFCQQAEQFIQETTAQYDVILCDLFIGEENPGFLFTHNFYEQLAKITHHRAIISINIQADTNQQLLLALFAIKKHFPCIALIEFDYYSNIVIICSLEKIPNKAVLKQRLANFTQLELTDLGEIIENISYIPPRK
tara:strand:+ start:6541 stop:7308 length:768 start_codon:yes stop_codon:yes gene_type:complete